MISEDEMVDSALAKVDAELLTLADEAKRVLENNIGFRLSLVVIDAPSKAFKLFFLPSSNSRQMEYANKVAGETYPLFAERVNAILGKAD